MDLRSMQCFVTAAKCGSFTRAAEQLFISQSAVSQSVIHLEKELGVALFLRQNNNVVLTHAGTVFLSEADSILQRTQNLRVHMSEIAENRTETLNLGISSFYGRYFLPDIIALAEKNNPHIMIKCVEDMSIRLEEMVVSGILDCCIVPQPIVHTELKVSFIRTETICLAIPRGHPLISRYPKNTPVPLAATAREPYIFLKKQQRFHELGMQLCREAGFSPNILYETMNWDTVDAIVARGSGIGFVPDILLHRAAPDKPEYRRIASDTARRGYVLLTPQNGIRSAGIADFLSALPGIFNE